MNKHDHSKNLFRTTGVAAALCALVALGSQSAFAGSSAVTDPSQLGPFTFNTGPYPGTEGSTLPSGFTRPAGPLTTVTFIADGATPANSGAAFTRFNSDPPSGLLQADYPLGTTLIQTADINNVTTGPLQLDFNTGPANLGVAGFGVQVQDFAFDKETFTVQVFTAASSTVPENTFTFGGGGDNGIDNTGSNGKSTFVGAVGTNGELITKAIISSQSFDQGVDTGFDNNFFAAPVIIKNVPAVPEASTMVSLGMGLLLFGGLAFTARKRSMSQASASAS